ncbi:OLC1v1035392C1 [Oldenlandia corymbosa var. corymbosa]|uniref:OLC1v1035392C1 n=1 Tax=Oldenlandia corymbosa var. corymbosa TaxID=529605 RepID=A0AAV1CTM0_OLDCO|nr:OLC1v1035392C1 [Oldenlandia corymbosa var. corymbosa]
MENYRFTVFPAKSFSVFLVYSVSVLLFWDVGAAATGHGTNTPVHIGLILDSASPFGAMVDVSISMALQDFYTAHPDFQTRLILHRRDAQQELDVASAAIELMKNEEVHSLLGPQMFTQDKFIAELGGKVHVPVISFSGRSQSVSYEQTPYFVRTTPDDSNQARALVSICKGFDWLGAVILGLSNGSYNDLLYAIPNKTFDMVVGDATILADRAKYVDFTLPYSETGTVMVVRNRKDRDIWIFVKPFRWDLWLLIFGTCLCIGIVLQILEHSSKNGSDSIGPKKDKLGLSFPIASLAFPERDSITNKWSSFVMVVWLLMAFILMQSYTANLSAMFTVDQLDYRFSNDDYIGVQEGSFVRDFLINHLDIDKSRIREYGTIEDYHDAMTKGSKNGGIDAIFDEIPYMNLFLDQYGSEYKTVGPTYKTDGFGFAFPQGSPLVVHFSRAILAVTEGVNLSAIQQKNFGPAYSPSGDQSNSISSQSPKLTVYDFGGLFIIIGSALLFALFCSETPWGRRLTDKVATINQKSFSFPWVQGNVPRIHSSVHPDDSNRDSSGDIEEVQGSDHTNHEPGQEDLDISARNGHVNAPDQGNHSNEIQLSELGNTDTTERQTVTTVHANEAVWPSSHAFIDIGVVLDTDSPMGSMLNSSLYMALSGFYSVHANYKTRLCLHTKNAKTEMEVASAVMDLLKNLKVHGVLGPEWLNEATFVAELGEKAHVPVISFTAKSRAFSRLQNHYFARTALDDIHQVKDLAAICQEFKWQEVVVFYEDTEYGNLFLSKLDIYGLWAYDTVWALAMAAEKMLNLSVSKIGPRLLTELLRTNFIGLSGKFQLVDGQLQPTAFEIFNVIESGDRIVGYWTPSCGLSKSLSPNSSKELKAIMWPGETLVPPKAFPVPVTRKLKVGVPKKPGFEEFINVQFDPLTKQFNVSGFSIDVFHETRKLLPFKLDFEFVPFVNATGQSNGSYTDLLHKIVDQTYDFVVGDIAILVNRSKSVNFTLPYTESGVVMVLKNKKTIDMWTFLKPLRWDLWLTIVLICIFIGVVLGILERQNHDNQSQQLRLFFWLPIAVLAFPERNMVANKWSRFVLVVWLFVAYILMQSYTAKLSSIFTVDQLNFAFSTDFNVGYQSGSFVRDFLINELNLTESKLKNYTTIQEYHDAMSLGSKKGGIDAIYAEIPYVKLILNRYGSQYRIVGPTHKTDGFGFAFPMGSPLVSYFSRAILTVTQSSVMAGIEQKNFGPGYPTDLDSINQENPSLTAYNFGGLFIIVISATMLAVFFSKTSVGQNITSTVSNSGHKWSNLHMFGGGKAKEHSSQSSDEATDNNGENGSNELPGTGENPETVNNNVDIPAGQSEDDSAESNRRPMSVARSETSEIQMAQTHNRNQSGGA